VVPGDFDDPGFGVITGRYERNSSRPAAPDGGASRA
jgi:hypothetical protein